MFSKTPKPAFFRQNQSFFRLKNFGVAKVEQIIEETNKKFHQLIT